LLIHEQPVEEDVEESRVHVVLVEGVEQQSTAGEPTKATTGRAAAMAYFFIELDLHKRSVPARAQRKECSTDCRRVWGRPKNRGLQVRFLPGLYL
jgi:hypothetical protein